MNILIVDNCEVLRSFCTGILSDDGHTVIVANELDYSEVIRTTASDLDVIIANISPIYPEMASSIYNEAVLINPDIRILLMSTPWESKIITALLEKGCHFLTIPFTMEKFSAAVQEVSTLTHA